MSQYLSARKLFRILEPVLGLKGRGIRRLQVNLESQEDLVTITSTEYVVSGRQPEILAEPDFALLDKLIAVVEGRDDKTQTR